MEWRKQHEPIVITAFGAYIMSKHDEWRTKVAQEQGFLPLHQMEQQYRSATMRFVKETVKLYGKEVPATRVEYIDPPEGIRAPTKEEWHEYNRAQDTWIAEEVLRDWDWAHFVNYCKQADIEDFIPGHYPCESATRQCEMSCPKFINQGCEKWYEGLLYCYGE